MEEGVRFGEEHTPFTPEIKTAVCDVVVL